MCCLFQIIFIDYFNKNEKLSYVLGYCYLEYVQKINNYFLKKKLNNLINEGKLNRVSIIG